METPFSDVSEDTSFGTETLETVETPGANHPFLCLFVGNGVG